MKKVVLPINYAYSILHMWKYNQSVRCPLCRWDQTSFHLCIMIPADLFTIFEPWCLLLFCSYCPTKVKHLFALAGNNLGSEQSGNSFRALARAFSSCKPRPLVSRWPTLQSMVVSCLLEYKCRTVALRRMCFNKLPSPFVTAQQISVKANKDQLE